ncbi:MAG TPA: tRNA (adenosine(37)-N6)-dimethylallyltransferase MiaA [Burkholderiales bacterium]|nr:tRNA (adenosine(37)-N6)-dimethylallyltransferase MiaA [Burkholderiales bacterium]
MLGPTASGKSALAMALAERLPAEIVVMDSAQVYRGMDIGTAKPGAEERARVPHHLIDLVDPDQPYSAGRWRGEAISAAQEILGRQKIPLLVGGTMLYYRALVHGLDALPQADARVRAEIDAEAAQRGWPALHAELALVDPPAARRIMPNDAQRIQRALEVWRLTGKPLSVLQGASSQVLPFALKAFCVTLERAELHERIARRFDAMLAAGLLDELRELKKRYRLSARTPSMRAVGYRQAWEHLEGACSAAEMRSRAVAATRQLAKRQMTWLRAFRDVAPVPPDPERIVHSFMQTA